MHPDLRRAYQDEMAAARHCYHAGSEAAAMVHLERAHILGQRHVAPHVATHYWMLKIGLRRRAPRQVAGQLLRIVLGALGSALGIVPIGNTGGTDIGMFRRLPLDPALRRLLDK